MKDFGASLREWEAERMCESARIGDPFDRERFDEETRLMKHHLSLWSKIYEFDKATSEMR